LTYSFYASGNQAAMPDRVTKEKAKPRKAPEPKFNSKDPTDNSLVLLWLCINNMSGDQVSLLQPWAFFVLSLLLIHLQINFEAVAATLNITTIAAKFRFRRLKNRMDSKMEAFEKSKGAKPESATKPAQPAKEPANI
jgi:hypothetical protein